MITFLGLPDGNGKFRPAMTIRKDGQSYTFRLPYAFTYADAAAAWAKGWFRRDAMKAGLI
jgi:hypothetical protein